MTDQSKIDALRTPAPACPACEARRRHTAEERREYHPQSGHGYAQEVGWTHAALGKEKDS
jgi:hypothetical protein